MPSHSLERLVQLAQKTGGKLIVQNPLEDRDIVILDVDEYEKLVDKDYYEPNFGYNYDEEWNRGMGVEDEEDEFSAQEELDRIFGEPEITKPVQKTKSNWHSVGDVIERKIEDIPGMETEVQPGVDLKTVPFKPSDIDNWQEEPLLSDEPVFYEEPV